MEHVPFSENLVSQFCLDYNLEVKKVERLIEFVYGPKDLTRFNLVIKSLEGITHTVFAQNCYLDASDDIIVTIRSLVRVKDLVIKDFKKDWSRKGESIPANLIGLHPEYSLLIKKDKPQIEAILLYKWHLSWGA